MIPEIIARRYLVPDRRLETLSRRVASHLFADNEAHPSRGVPLRRAVMHAMAQKRFLPAGNTLLAGVEPIRPNCAILPPVTDATLPEVLERAANLWESRIGLGFSFDGCSDPVAALQALSERNAAIDLGHRPQRGNMATLSASHPRVGEFIRAKTASGPRRHALYNFNTSVVLRDEDLRRPGRADGVLRVVAEAAWDGGDPGVVFLDRITGCLPYDYPSVSRALGEIDTLVPCGEQSMHPNETCGLGAVNLAADAFWRQERGAWRFNERSFSETVELAVRALDRAQSLTDFAGDAALQKASRATRRIGLGLMGWHDAVQSRALGAEEQAALLRTVGLLFRAASHQASAALGREVGSCQLATDCPRAHLTVTCVPPTGGITLLAGNRSFALDPLPQELDRMSVGRQLASARDWQPYFDNTISKTINVPFDATPQDVHNVFLAALETGLKTLTVYRSGSRSHQPLQTHHASCETC